MINFIKRNTFPAIIAFSALSVSGSAAFYSVYGLSKLFAGAQFEVIIMAGSLEIAKLVIASLLYQYWDTINKLLRTYLTVAAFILVLITSMGIYGFLSAAYQDTYKSLIVNQNKIEFLENKAEFYENDVNRFDKELQQIMDNISNLSNAKSRSIQVKDTSVAGGIRNTISTVDLRLAQNRLTIEENNRKDVYLRRTIAADSLQKYKLEILELENNADISGELGPLKYLSGLTGTPMDKIINWLLLIIIFVFDPLAISLVVAANFAFNQANRKNLYGEVEELTLKKQAKKTDWENYTEEDEKRMDVIGQNGNDGEHYEEEDHPVPLTKVARILQKGPSKNRVITDKGEEKWVDKDDNTIRYL
tara:strand:- start:160 stop:1242 length:1083 start_codon:yes stop_codon:yes gene_type:complete